MNSNESIDLLKEQLYTSKTNYYWEHIGSDGNYSPLIRWLLALFIGLFLPIFLMIVGDIRIWSSGFWFCFILASMGVLITRYLFIPDKHRCYNLTSMGIHYTEQDMIPEIAYKIARGLAWVGIAVCIIAVVVLGPLAFVGAGAFALMSFGMTNFHSTIQKHEVFFSEKPILFNFVKDTTIRIDSNTASNYCCSRDFFFSSLEQKNKVIVLVREYRKDIEYVELTKRNDMFKHPIFIQD